MTNQANGQHRELVRLRRQLKDYELRRKAAADRVRIGVDPEHWERERAKWETQCSATRKLLDAAATPQPREGVNI